MALILGMILFGEGGGGGGGGGVGQRGKTLGQDTVGFDPHHLDLGLVQFFGWLNLYHANNLPPLT